MPCALCLKNKPLRRSHIVPEFMFESMYDQKHRFFGLSSVPAKQDKLFQKGLRERLLCGDCEQHIGRYESYASGVFCGSTVKRVSRLRNTLFIAGLDYKPLFFMSLLWRFGVTKLECYQGADLGPHKERLRQLILADDPSDCLSYPCLVVAITLDGTHVPDLIVPPSLARLNQQWIWSLVVAGFLLTFFVSSHSPPNVLYPAFLQPHGNLAIQIRDMREIAFLYRTACEIGSAQRIRQNLKQSQS